MPRVLEYLMGYKWFALALVLALFGLRVGCGLVGEHDRSLLNQPAPHMLPVEDQARLRDAGWERRVGEALGLWVSVTRQRLVGIKAGRILFSHACSTAAKGTGSRDGSNQTPLGWHEIVERIGDGSPLGAVFVERKPTGKVWSRSNQTAKDYVLTRILWLRGLEPGINAGPGVDSHDRFIYIHGTPAEEKLGTPASMGCIRLSNAAIIEVFDRCSSGTKVLISE